MEKRNSKAAVICITFVIIALAAGIFIGWTMGRNDKKSEAQTQTQSESVSDSTPATEVSPRHRQSLRRRQRRRCLRMKIQRLL